MESKVFDIEIAGLELPFEFYTFDSIKDDLKNIFGERVEEYKMNVYRKWSQIRKGNKNKAYFFTYIKFFIEKETNIKYGLIGGKTNYNSPDITLHDKEDNEKRFGRLFIESNKYEMSDTILVIHHEKIDDDSMKALDNDLMQALFIERYVQRKYNLFDS